MRFTDEKNLNYGLQFVIAGDKRERSGILNIYGGRSGISVVAGGKATGRLKNLLDEFSQKYRKPKTSSPLRELPPPPWIGTDESGKGDYFGPLVVAGLWADRAIAAGLEAHGVRDSKAITDNRCRELSEIIASQVGKDRLSIIEIEPADYNKQYENEKRRGGNLNTLLAQAHAQVIEGVLPSHTRELTVISDQFGNPRLLQERLLSRTQKSKVNLIQTPKAERNTAVAAASILARSRFLSWLESAAQEWQLSLPKGCGPAVQAMRNTFISKHGKEKLREVAKLHFSFGSKDTLF